MELKSNGSVMVVRVSGRFSFSFESKKSGEGWEFQKNAETRVVEFACYSTVVNPFESLNRSKHSMEGKIQEDAKNICRELARLLGYVQFSEFKVNVERVEVI